MLSMVSFFPNIEFLTMKYSPPTQIQPHHDLMAKHLNSYQCITAKIHSSINTMSKYTLINTCTLRSVTRHKSFAGNMLSLKFECGPLCRKLALCHSTVRTWWFFRSLEILFCFPLRTRFPMKTLVQSQSHSNKNYRIYVWKELLVISYQIREWNAALTFLEFIYLFNLLF